MAQHHHPDILAGAVAEYPRNLLADTTEALGMTDLRRGQDFPVPVDGLGPLGHQHQ